MSTIGLKKTPEKLLESFQQSFNRDCYELDELFWFIEKKAKTETRENVYVMTMITREPRQIVSFDVQYDKNPACLQGLGDNALGAENYCTDGNLSYLDVIFPSKYIRNVRDKRNTHNVESINADLRHYIPVLARRSRCFCRKLETFQTVIEIFVDAYNSFGAAKMNFRKNRDPKSRELPFSVLDFF